MLRRRFSDALPPLQPGWKRRRGSLRKSVRTLQFARVLIELLSTIPRDERVQPECPDPFDSYYWTDYPRCVDRLASWKRAQEQKQRWALERQEQEKRRWALVVRYASFAAVACFCFVASLWTSVRHCSPAEPTKPVFVPRRAALPHMKTLEFISVVSAQTQATGLVVVENVERNRPGPQIIHLVLSYVPMDDCALSTFVRPSRIQTNRFHVTPSKPQSPLPLMLSSRQSHTQSREDHACLFFFSVHSSVRSRIRRLWVSFHSVFWHRRRRLKKRWWRGFRVARSRLRRRRFFWHRRRRLKCWWCRRCLLPEPGRPRLAWRHLLSRYLFGIPGRPPDF